MSYIILHVEDDPNDAFFVQRAIAKARLPVQVQRVGDGQEAIDYLSGVNTYSDRLRYPLPRLMLLDLKLPLLDGFEVLSWTRHREEVRELPIVILSSSGHPQDQDRATALGANHYCVKTAMFEDVVLRIRDLLPTDAEGTQVSSGDQGLRASI